MARLLLLIVLASAGSLYGQYQWSCHYPDLGYPPYDGSAWEGFHSVKYVSYIPADYIQGPSSCTYDSAGPVKKIYKGDPGAILYGFPPQSWRTSSFYTFTITDGYRGPFWNDPGQTRNYGYHSPANGSTLSSADEDGVANDCYLWNQSGYADNSNWVYDLSIPYSTQGQVHYSGTGSNPLESSFARIAWDLRTVVDISNLDRITASVNYNHTCFPAHSVSVNNFVVYNWTPPRADGSYIFNCLVLQLDKVVGQQSSATQVPCN
jgi:hypothetical protein